MYSSYVIDFSKVNLFTYHTTDHLKALW